MKVQMEKTNDEINKLKGQVETLQKEKGIKAPTSMRTAVGNKLRDSVKDKMTTGKPVASTPQITKSKYGGVSSRLNVPSKTAAGGASSPKGTAAKSPRGTAKTGLASSRGIGGGLKKPSTAATGAAAPKTPGPSLLKAPNNTRPQTSMGTISRPTPGGLKAPSSVKKEEAKTGASSTASTPLKRAPTQSLRNIPAGPKSAETDQVDDIYKNDDPIAISVEARKKAGALTSTVAKKNKSEFFFTIK